MAAERRRDTRSRRPLRQIVTCHYEALSFNAFLGPSVIIGLQESQSYQGLQAVSKRFYP